jgi:chromosome segregation ATPase
LGKARHQWLRGPWRRWQRALTRPSASRTKGQEIEGEGAQTEQGGDNDNNGSWGSGNNYSNAPASSWLGGAGGQVDVDAGRTELEATQQELAVMQDRLAALQRVAWDQGRQLAELEDHLGLLESWEERVQECWRGVEEQVTHLQEELADVHKEMRGAQQALTVAIGQGSGEEMVTWIEQFERHIRHEFFSCPWLLIWADFFGRSWS